MIVNPFAKTVLIFEGNEVEWYSYNYEETQDILADLSFFDPDRHYELIFFAYRETLEDTIWLVNYWKEHPDQGMIITDLGNFIENNILSKDSSWKKEGF